MGQTASILTASRDGDLSEVQEYLRQQVDVNFSKRNAKTALIYASSNGHLRIVDALLTAGANPDLMDKKRFTAIMYASENGHLAVVKRLLQANASVKYGLSYDYMRMYSNVHLVLVPGGRELWRYEFYSHALCKAVIHNHEEVVECLLQAGAKATEHVEYSHSHTLLTVAIANGSIAIVRKLLAHGAHIWTNPSHHIHQIVHAALVRGDHQIILELLEYDYAEYYITYFKDQPNTLIWATTRNDLKALQTCLLQASDHGIALEIALTMAAGNGQLAMIKELLEHEDYLISHWGKHVALTLAIKNGHLDCAHCLINYGAQTNTKCKNQNALFAAIHQQSLDLVKILLDPLLHINEANNQGITPLILAAKVGCLSIVNFLLTYSVCLNQQNNRGVTALFMAARFNHCDVLNKLLQAGANINLTSNRGNTALIRVSCNGYEPIVDILLTNGAQVDVANNMGDTALHCAASNGHTTIVQKLLPHTEMIDQRNNYGRTALMEAAVNGHLTTVKTLIQHGADLQVKDNKQKSALDLAIELSPVAQRLAMTDLLRSTD